MNLLAHALLSPADPLVLVGNLTADWVKGRARRALPEGMQAGMELHGRIDAFTDTHPIVVACGELLAPAWGRYSPVLVDVLFDHVLSVQWERWCGRPRERVIAEAYAALRAHLHVLPPFAHWAANALLADDWFSCYATLDGIAACLTRMSARLNARGHDIELAAAVSDFRRQEGAFHDAFREFFPALRSRLGFPPAPV
jgi:acyl carrier protein phosphodiesterase